MHKAVANMGCVQDEEEEKKKTLEKQDTTQRLKLSCQDTYPDACILKQ
jgi:hypothetical protein